MYRGMLSRKSKRPRLECKGPTPSSRRQCHLRGTASIATVLIKQVLVPTARLQQDNLLHISALPFRLWTSHKVGSRYQSHQV